MLLTLGLPVEADQLPEAEGTKANKVKQ